MPRKLLINRAPVLTLWAVVVAERLGLDEDAAFSLGKAVAGLTAQRKGRRLGIYQAKDHPEPGETEKPDWYELVGRAVPVKQTAGGLRAVIRGKEQDPASTRRYLEQKFGDDLDAARAAMRNLAARFEPGDLERAANKLYEKFRPAIPAGKRGWGAKGELDLDLLESLGG